MIDDEPGTPPQADTARAIQLHSELLAWPARKQDLAAADPSLLSFYLAASLPLDLDFKQKLLSLRSESERLSLLINISKPSFPTFIAQRVPGKSRRQRTRPMIDAVYPVALCALCGEAVFSARKSRKPILARSSAYNPGKYFGGSS
jgi:hypothetical protein